MIIIALSFIIIILTFPQGEALLSEPGDYAQHSRPFPERLDGSVAQRLAFLESMSTDSQAPAETRIHRDTIMDLGHRKDIWPDFTFLQEAQELPVTVLKREERG